MVRKVLKYIKDNHMIESGDKIIVGVSGGADSVCLLFMLMEISRQIPLSLIAVHVEHGLRGAASLRDADYVEALCREYQIEFRKYSYDVRRAAKERKISMEEAGRELRYSAFEEVRAREQAGKIAVAHHMNDSAETMLMNLFRGTGLKGLCGVPPVRGAVIRPLLCLERREIEAYLNRCKISYCTDLTNSEDVYTRNKLRMHIIPYVQKNVNEQAVSHMAGTAGILTEIEQYVERIARLAFNDCTPEGNPGSEIAMDVKKLKSYDAVIQKYVIRMCMEYLTGSLKDFTVRNLDSVMNLINMETGRELNLPYGVNAVKSYESIKLHRELNRDKKPAIAGTVPAGVVKANIDHPVEIPGTYEIEAEGLTFTFSLINYEKNLIIPEKTYTKWFDYDRIKGTLRLRTRETGDYIEINRDHGRKKMKSFLIDQKVPREERDHIILLAEGHHIIWAVGYRISEFYKVTGDTKHILEVHANGGNENA